MGRPPSHTQREHEKWPFPGKSPGVQAGWMHDYRQCRVRIGANDSAHALLYGVSQMLCDVASYTWLWRCKILIWLILPNSQYDTPFCRGRMKIKAILNLHPKSCLPGPSQHVHFIYELYVYICQTPAIYDVIFHRLSPSTIQANHLYAPPYHSQLLFYHSYTPADYDIK